MGVPQAAPSPYHVAQFDYDLPPELIAQEPLADRSSSRLLVVDRAQQSLTEVPFHQIGDYLREGDVLVRNDTRVIPARLRGRLTDGAACEALFIAELIPGTWSVLAKPARRLRPGTTVDFGGVVATAVDPATLNPTSSYPVGQLRSGERVLQFAPGTDVRQVFRAQGEMPLPPYIKQGVSDPERYQTVYAKNEGAIAAPTAGFHFTAELTDSLRAKGVQVVEVTLHVGPGTFQPVRDEEDYRQHRMLPEEYRLSVDAARTIAAAKASGRRVIAVGSTSLRVLESVGPQMTATHGWTELYVYPGHSFQVVDALVTNFHLPRTTLLLMVMAFGGEPLLRQAYERAVRDRFRFFSFGDAMLIL